ncbi:hypothetical protein BDR04DRAFT_1122890 [Suillus decipiens]|nr:hypothetical protein BDR04DRAFT_1122890 [Suillus decipiens]
MTTFYMPLHCTPAALFFNGNPVDLLTFLITVDQLADMAGITEVAHIKAATWYAHPDEAELWECLEEYNSNNYEEFANTVLYAYPGHGNETSKCTIACPADALLADSYEEDAIEYSDANTCHAVITPITNTKEQTTPTDITTTLLTFKILLTACQDKVPVPAASPLNIVLLPVQHSKPSLLADDICNADNTVHNSYSETLIPLESAITVTHSATTNEEADTTEIEHKCLLMRYSINIEATPFIDAITKAITECPPLIKVLPLQIETMQQNPQPPCAPRLVPIEEIPDANDSHPWPYSIICCITANRFITGHQHQHLAQEAKCCLQRASNPLIFISQYNRPSHACIALSRYESRTRGFHCQRKSQSKKKNSASPSAHIPTSSNPTAPSHTYTDTR